MAKQNLNYLSIAPFFQFLALTFFTCNYVNFLFTIVINFPKNTKKWHPSSSLIFFPQGSLNSIYGSRHGSRHGSNISSRGSNSSTISWQSLQILRRIASSRAGSIQGKSPPSLQTHLYEHSMMYGDADPDSYRQSLVAGYLTQLPTIDNSAAEEIVHHHSTTSNQILELPMLNATLSNSQTTTTLKPAGTENIFLILVHF